MNDKKIKCNRCHVDLLASFFIIKRCGNYYKTCIKCKETQNKNKQKHICNHGKNKYICIDCKGGGICEHNNIKSRCKECGGSQICIHKKRKEFCKECIGASICEHNRQKFTCKRCNGNGICEHNKQKTKCKNCNGLNILCNHGKNKYICHDCKGCGICEHKTQKTHCKKCKGSAICQHNNIKPQCIECTPSIACQNCFHVYVDPRSRFKPYCFRCYCVLNPNVEIPRKYTMKEHHMINAMKHEFNDIKMVFNKQIKDGCSNRRPDIRIECLTHTVIIECDENQHKYTSCEDKRMMEIFQDLGNRPLVMIRFNPDKYDDVEGCFKYTKTGSLSLNKKEWNERLLKLIIKIRHFLEHIPDKEITIEYMYYNDKFFIAR